MDSLDFIGRTIYLPDLFCGWRYPHNVQCPGAGQMNWAVFDTLSLAEAYVAARHQIVARGRWVKVVKEEKVRVKFEGMETTALKVRLKIKLPKFLIGDQRAVVYFITAQVRGKYVGCILSQYETDAPINGLAPLLSEVMTLQGADGKWKETPHAAKPAQTSPAEIAEEPSPELPQKKKFEGSFLKLEAGSWIPVGKLANKFDVSPTFGLWIRIPMLEFKTIEVRMGVNLTLPQHPKNFDFLMPDSAFQTRAKGPLATYGIQMTKPISIRGKSNINYIDLSLGLGGSQLSTVTRKPTAGKSDKANYWISTMNFNGGFALRKTLRGHSSVALGLQYYFTPQRLFSSHVGPDFGSSSITTSIQFQY